MNQGVIMDIQSRIDTKGIRAEDIKHANRLTDDEIASIDITNIYQWVRTGQWKQKDFKRWAIVMCIVDPP
jgi:hypothetical protein